MTARGFRQAAAVMVCAILAAALPKGVLEASRDVRTVKGVEFQGLKYLSRWEILALAAYRIEGDSLVIDLGSLREGLDKMPMVRRYALEEKDGRLSVTVEENVPAYVVLLDGGGPLMPLELDGGMRVLSTGTIHAVGRPLILAGAGDMAGGAPSARLRGIISTLSRLEAEGLPVMREIEEVDMTSHPQIRIRLKGRPTVFTLDIGGASFRTLSVLAGYLDAARYYPAKAKVRPEAAVLK